MKIEQRRPDKLAAIISKIMNASKDTTYRTPLLWINVFLSVTRGSSNEGDTILKITLREQIFAGINFREFFSGHFARINFRELGFTENFAGINFRKLSLTNDFAVINFCESALFKDLTGVDLTFAFRNIFSMTLVYGFENNFSKS